MTSGDVGLYSGITLMGVNPQANVALPGNIEVTYGITRPNNLAVMWCIKAWNAPINQGQIDISALALEVSNLANMADFTVIYPGGGNKTSPGGVATNSRYIAANPFPGYHVFCTAQVLYNGEWANPEFGDHFSGIGGPDRYGHGVQANQMGNSIIVQTGVNGLVYPNALSGAPFLLSATTGVSPLPCRVLVWRLKGVIA